MKKTENTRPKKMAKKQEYKPQLKWQTGEYQRHAEFNFMLPYQFLLLCKLMDITPFQVLTDFMDNLSCGSWRREGREKAKEKLIDYFIEHGYGQRCYSAEDIRCVFKEMDAIGMVWPDQGNSNLIDLTDKWRSKYHAYWFKKWFRKPRRKLE